MASYQIEVVNLKTTPDFGTRPGDIYIGRRFGKHPGSRLPNRSRSASTATGTLLLQNIETI
jgi:hypothetical protein